MIKFYYSMDYKRWFTIWISNKYIDFVPISYN